MSVTFTKMQGLGNDFVVVESFTQAFQPDAERIRAWADRRFGIGFDQLLWLSPPIDSQHVARYRIFNADGLEAHQCGNGARCIGRFLVDGGFTRQPVFTVEVVRGAPLVITRVSADQFSINMGCPSFKADVIPFLADQAFAVDQQKNLYRLLVEGVEVQYCVMSMGNPHAVVFVHENRLKSCMDCAEKEGLASVDVKKWGDYFQQSLLFPEGVNVGFVDPLSSQAIALRVYERGVGETLACGTGACAAVVAGNAMGILNNCVSVSQSGGASQVTVSNELRDVTLSGPAVTVYRGQI